MNHVLPISPSVFRTCGDVIVPKDELLCYSAAHADVHLSQQLGSCLAPAVILWKHRHLKHGTVYQKNPKNPQQKYVQYCKTVTKAHMAQSWSSRHDSSLIDGHCIFGVIGNNGMAGLVVCGNGLILLVNFNTPPLRA